MKNYSFIISGFLLAFASPLLAQGPPPPPPPSGVPMDGGLIAFLILSVLGGARYLRKK